MVSIEQLYPYNPVSYLHLTVFQFCKLKVRSRRQQIWSPWFWKPPVFRYMMKVRWRHGRNCNKMIMLIYLPFTFGFASISHDLQILRARIHLSPVYIEHFFHFPWMFNVYMYERFAHGNNMIHTRSKVCISKRIIQIIWWKPVYMVWFIPCVKFNNVNYAYYLITCSNLRALAP